MEMRLRRWRASWAFSRQESDRGNVMSEDGAPTQPGLSRGSVNPWLVLVLICVAQFMVVLDATIVNVALPSIQTDLGLSVANLQWIINAYTLVFGGFLLLGGRAGDLLGRKVLRW
jgi:MFS transporter